MPGLNKSQRHKYEVTGTFAKDQISTVGLIQITLKLSLVGAGLSCLAKSHHDVTVPYTYSSSLFARGVLYPGGLLVHVNGMSGHIEKPP